MENNNKEIIFYEKGLALTIANLDYAVELLTDLNYKDVSKLDQIVDLYSEVEDFDKWKEINVMLDKFISDISKDDNLNKNGELFVLLNEPKFINKYLVNLLESSNYEVIDEDDVERYLKDNFHTTIKKLLDIKNIEEVFNNEALEVLKILVKENKFKDMIEGLGILFAFATNDFKTLQNTELEVYTLLTEADALASFIFFMEDDEMEG